nr:MAG TPA: hypothetical protein [Caudoviricetes sp.]
MNFRYHKLTEFPSCSESQPSLSPPLPPLFTTFAEAPMSCDLAGGDKVKQER